MPRTLLSLLLLAAGLSLPAAAQKRTLSEDERATFASEMKRSLQDHILDAWYPRAIDRQEGGFLSRFTYDWTPEGPQHKMIVTQSRHTWTTARAAAFLSDRAATYRSASKHGYAFLRDRMWDDEHSGFFWLVTRAGQPIPEDSTRALTKQSYGNAFAIYGLTAYYEATGDSSALRLAQRTFRWLEKHAHDSAHGGYFNHLARDGTPFRTGYEGTPPKGQNTSIHLLEAFTDLYRVWPSPLLRDRLHEMLRIVRDRLVTDRGYLRLFATADWQPISYRDSSQTVREANAFYDHVSFGHDVETAYLMLEASDALGLENDAHTLQIGKKMVDHALRNGWDTGTGGFYDAGYYFKGDSTLTVTERTKNWWAQAEGLNTLLLMGDRFPNDPMRYHEKWRTLWNYTQTYLIDQEHGGWYPGGIDQAPQQKNALKGQIWKASYHTARALMNCIERLNAAPR